MAHSGRRSVSEEADKDNDNNLATLAQLDEEIMTSRLFQRYSEDKIYTYIGDILVAVNPLKNLPIYGPEFSSRYRRALRSQFPPHIFAMADTAYSAMMADSRSQCIVISGESGAGKTESAKFIIQQLISLSPVRSAIALEQKIIQVNPLLEAFGNAVTGMNDNSSRFGKYIQLSFRGGQVMGAKISEYLLEKSRVVWQSKGEENFHVFYYLLAGLKADERQQYHLSLDNYRYLAEGLKNVHNQRSTLEQEYQRLLNAMDMVGFTDEDQRNMFLALATVLNLGNVEIGENSVGCSYIASMEQLNHVSSLVGIDTDILTSFLTKKETLTAGETITMNLTAGQASDGRDAVAKVLYGRMFGWIVNRVNCLLASQEPTQPKEHVEIGILDIFGFEHFESNHFEQLCINLANEQLQYFFNQHIFMLEQEEYNKEGINLKEITFVDNTPLLDMFFKKITGVFAILDEESFFPKGTDKSFVEKMSEKISSSYYQKSKQTASAQFSIKHYAGLVVYSADGFLERNRDTLLPGTLELFQASGNELIQDICMSTITRTGTLAMKSRHKKSSRMKRRQERPQRKVAATNRRGLTVSAQFKNSLQLLLEKMRACQPHFIRCIKPNTEKMASHFDKDFVLAQLRYTGMLETTRIRREGFPVRPSFTEFVRKFKCLAHLKIEPSAQGCRKILDAAKLSGYRIGKCKVFLRYHHMDSLLEQLGRVHQAAEVLQKVLRGHTSRRRFATVRASAKKQENERLDFFHHIARSILPVKKKLLSFCQEDEKRSQGAGMLPSPDLPLPPSKEDLEVNMQETQQATVSGESDSEGEDEIDGEDIDEVEPIPESWKNKFKNFGQEGTKDASIRWFRATQVQRSAIKQDDGKVRPWFQGIISRRHAEQILTKKPVGCFLIRVSESRFGYTLSVRVAHRCKHFMIEQTASGKYMLIGESLVHKSLQELITYHQKVPIGQEKDLLTIPCGLPEGQQADFSDLLDNPDEAKTKRSSYAQQRGFSSDEVLSTRSLQTPPLHIKSRPRSKTSAAEVPRGPPHRQVRQDQSSNVQQTGFSSRERLMQSQSSSSPEKAGGRFRSLSTELPQQAVGHIKPPQNIQMQPISHGRPRAHSEDLAYLNDTSLQHPPRGDFADSVEYINTTQPPVPKGPRPSLTEDPIYINTKQPPLPSRGPAKDGAAPTSTASASNHRPQAITLTDQRPMPGRPGQPSRINISPHSSTNPHNSGMSNLDHAPRKQPLPGYPRPPQLPQKAKRRPVSCTDNIPNQAIGSPPDLPLSAPPSLNAQQISCHNLQGGQWKPGMHSHSPFQRPAAPLPPTADDGYLTPGKETKQRLRSWTEAGFQSRPLSFQGIPYSAPAGSTDYLDPIDSGMSADNYFNQAAEYLDPADEFASGDEYLDPVDDLTGRSLESTDSVSTSLPVYLECISEGQDAEMAPSLPHQHHSDGDAKRTIDAEVHQFESMIKETQAQINAIQQEMQEKGLTNPNFNTLLQQETACEERLASLKESLAHAQACKSPHSEAGEVDSLAAGRKSPHPVRRVEDIQLSTQRHGSTVRKRIEARKRKQQQERAGQH